MGQGKQFLVRRNFKFPICAPGFGFPDDVVIEKKNKGDSFVESTGVDVKLRNIKFIQHDAIEGILCEYTPSSGISCTFEMFQRTDCEQTVDCWSCVEFNFLYCVVNLTCVCVKETHAIL